MGETPHRWPDRSSVRRRTLAAVSVAAAMAGLGLPAPDAEAVAGTRAQTGADIAIGVDPVVHENEPTVAANPRSPKRLVAGSHRVTPPTNRCAAYRSSDGGTTWSAAVLMPQLTVQSNCSDPVLAYAPDGSRVYYAYMDIKPGATADAGARDQDIVVSYSDDDGATWSAPVIALDGAPSPTPDVPGFRYDKPWIGTHVDEDEGSWVYVSATRFDSGPTTPCSIAFTRSGARGATGTWTTPTELDSSGNPCGRVVVQGSRPTGGLGGDVLVAWYDSGADGFLTGTFDIQTRYSSDHGATFGPVGVAARDGAELPNLLGPNGQYHRWGAAVDPDVEIDPGGGAHVAYTHDPVPGSSTPEDGDIRYVSSGGPPYTTWSLPQTVNDDGTDRAQGYATLETLHGGASSHVWLLWEDHRLSSQDNATYDIFAARRVPGQDAFGPNLRVSDATSTSDASFIGDYFDLTPVSGALFAVWTDRRHQTDVSQLEDNVFGSRVGP